MENQSIISQSQIISKIYIIRGQRVMMDRDLAKLYDVSTTRLNEQVKRNLKRFPYDFMFQLNKDELKNWISQFAISNNSIKMGIRKPPYVFTEQGIAMLSSVLHSDRAIAVNIQIMRTFIQFRKLILTNKELRLLITKIEKKVNINKDNIQILANLIQKLFDPPKTKKVYDIGFKSD